MIILRQEVSLLVPIVQTENGKIQNLTPTSITSRISPKWRCPCSNPSTLCLLVIFRLSLATLLLRWLITFSIRFSKKTTKCKFYWIQLQKRAKVQAIVGEWGHVEDIKYDLKKESLPTQKWHPFVGKGGWKEWKAGARAEVFSNRKWKNSQINTWILYMNQLI